MDSFTFTLGVLTAAANIIIALAVLINVIKNNAKVDALDKKVDGHLNKFLETVQSIAKPIIMADRRSDKRDEL